MKLATEKKKMTDHMIERIATFRIYNPRVGKKKELQASE